MTGADGPPRVDVGIVSWNTRELTLTAIGRLLDASRDVDLKVLLRDNGSTDGTVGAVRARYPDVDIDAGENVGFARGVNCLLARSSAPWFLTLNSDAWPEPGAVRTMVEVGAATPRAAAVAPLLCRPAGDVEPSVHALPSLRLAAVTALGAGPLLGARRARDWCLPPHWAHDRERDVGWAVGAALLLRREALDEIGGLDDGLFMYGEDLDWCWRAARAGWQVVFTPRAVVRHVGNASGAQRYGESRERVAIGNANAVVRRHLGARGLPWQGLNALGALRRAAVAAARRDRDLARFWWRQVPAHLGLRKVA
jgi:GT2 family glycosyltransferase